MKMAIAMLIGACGAACPALAQTCEPHWESDLGFAGLDGGVAALRTTQEGGTPALYVGGTFVFGAGLELNRVGRFANGAWSPVGDGIAPPTHALFGCCARVYTLSVLDTGAGPGLYVGGDFILAGTVQQLLAESIARFQGGVWHDLQGGLAFNACPECVPRAYASVVWDAGSGPGLYVGGSFLGGGSVATNNIARWDGLAWSAVGGGVTENRPGSPTPAWVQSLAVFDDGSGSALYAAGQFTDAGSVQANSIAKWDGASWAALGQGLGPNGEEPPFAYGFAMAPFNDGSGEALYVGGEFSLAGGQPAANIARWDGASWGTVGAGVNAMVRSMAVFDDGTGPALYVGGDFTEAGGSGASSIARWDGTAWTPVGSGLDSAPYAMEVFDDGASRALVVGGWFTQAGGQAAMSIARWVGCDTCYADCSGEGQLTIADFACFQNRFVTADPYADCNQDSRLTVADFGCFQTAFVAGCP